jgi:hypothetical protein
MQNARFGNQKTAVPERKINSQPPTLVGALFDLDDGANKRPAETGD